MSRLHCAREKEIAESLRLGQWPVASTPELRAHAEGCRVCGDRVLLTQSFGRARAASLRQAALVPPGLLWWRAQLRRRNAALAQVSRPVVGAQFFALAVYTAAATALAISQARHGLRWLAWLGEMPRSEAFHLGALFAPISVNSDWTPMFLMAGLGLAALFGGVALFIASDRS